MEMGKCGNTSHKEKNRLWVEGLQVEGTEAESNENEMSGSDIQPTDEGAPDSSKAKHRDFTGYCHCASCIDYRVLRMIRKSGLDCTVAKVGSFLQKVCFDETNAILYHTNDDYNNYTACDHSYSHRFKISSVRCSEYNCSQLINGNYEYVNCEGRNIDIESRQDVWCDGRCDIKKDGKYCIDESDCNGYKYGLNCTKDSEEYYIPSQIVCGTNEYFDMNEKCNMKEICSVTKNTKSTCTHYQTHKLEDFSKEVPILNYTRCATIGKHPYCLNYHDQTNCSDKERVGGYCNINGYPSNVSNYVVCKEHLKETKLCDDNLHNDCSSYSGSDCTVHKYRTCDGVQDCFDGSDELYDACRSNSSILSNFTCKRRFTHHVGEIPMDWIRDNEVDCLNGQDENDTRWTVCNGTAVYEQKIVLPADKCKEVLNFFKCPGGDKNIMFKDLCDGIESCNDYDDEENTVCRVARDFPMIHKTASYKSSTVRDICAVNEKTDLDCTVKNFLKRHRGEIFGAREIKVNVPNLSVSCFDMFGENYVFLSCMNLCKEKDVICPLNLDAYGKVRVLKYNSCPGQFLERIYTPYKLADQTSLTFALEAGDGKFHQEIFRCKNGRCVNYTQVCDLIDDCGDKSDEDNCRNHMICKDTSLGQEKSQFLARSQKCDGIHDCFDLSDECNEDCGKEILGGWMLKIACCIMGILAVIFNMITVPKEVMSLKRLRNEPSSPLVMNNNFLVCLIGCGDFLVGLYLVILSVYDSIIFGKDFCRKQAEWLTGATCATLGVINTVGSQLSLFSMTVLSFFRMSSVYIKSLTLPSYISWRRDLVTAGSVLGITIASLAAALVPLLPSLEDYFVQGMYYDPSYKVFIGFPNKDRNIEILNVYYNKSPDTTANLSWKEIGTKVDGMYSLENGELHRSPVHFYGNDGICLFKYFVRTDDPRRNRNNVTGADITSKKDVVVWTMLILNLLCFVSMAICYIILVVSQKRSSQRVGLKSKQNERLQRRVTIILVTDFLCWVPFLFVSALHNLGRIDASWWYTPFAMTVLPLNSVLNPLIYNDSIRSFFYRKVNSIAGTCMTGFRGLMSRVRQARSSAADYPEEHVEMEEIQSAPML